MTRFSSSSPLPLQIIMLILVLGSCFEIEITLAHRGAAHDDNLDYIVWVCNFSDTSAIVLRRSARGTEGEGLKYSQGVLLRLGCPWTHDDEDDEGDEE